MRSGDSGSLHTVPARDTGRLTQAGRQRGAPAAAMTAAAITRTVTLPELIELADLERPHWEEKLTLLRASGTPLNAGEPEAEAEDDTADDDSDETDDDKDDDDDTASELEKARKAAAAANRELKRIKAEQGKASERAKREAGEFRELYEETKAKLEALERSREVEAKERLALGALSKLKARNPTRAVKLLDLDDVDDEASAERAVKRLLKTDDYLFETAPTRQKRANGSGPDQDTDDDGPKRPPVSRLRRGLEAAATP